MKKSNRVLAFLFALVMLVTAMPFSATAATSTLKQEAQALINAKNSYTSVQKNVNYNGSDLKKGTKVVFDTSLYTLTVNITNVSGTKITAQGIVKGKFGSQQGYKVSVDNSWRYGGTIANGIGSASDTFDTDEAYGGTQYLKFEVTCAFADIIDRNAWTSAGYSLDDYVEYRDKFDGYIEKPHYLCFGVKEKVTFTGPNKVTKNSVTFAQEAWEPHNEYGKAIGWSNIKGSGTVVYYKEESQSTWNSKTFKSNSKMTITGLKPDTKYNFRCKYYTTIVNPENKQNVTTYSDYFNGYNVNTASAKALKVKKIKTSGYKVKTFKSNGYWYWGTNTLKWIPPKTTKLRFYKVTVTVSNLPKNTQGIIVSVNSDTNGGRWAKGKKKKYTVTVAEPVNKKGNKRTVKVYAAANNTGTYGLGYSPAATKKIKIKK